MVRTWYGVAVKRGCYREQYKALRISGGHDYTMACPSGGLIEDCACGVDLRTLIGVD